MYHRLWTLLEQRGQQREDPSTWRGPGGSRLHAMRKGDVAPKDNATLRAALDTVFGGSDWSTGETWAQALVTFPSAQRWIVPKRTWHLDFPYRYTDFVSGVNVFLLVDDLAKGGGGTCVVQSSPRLIARFVATVPDVESRKQSELTIRLFQSHPWFQELRGNPTLVDRNERLMDHDTCIDGVPVRVVELTGKAGDVFLCHPWLLHCASPNALDRPRMMRACRLFHDSVPGGRVFDPGLKRPQLPEFEDA